MRDFQLFFPFYVIIISQRMIELFIARKNEKWMKKQGAVEFGQKHYRYIVVMHILFFIVLLGEKFLRNESISLMWPWLAIAFILTQMIRVWAILSLGKYWNTKIIVLPNETIIRSGPYNFIRHPNYTVVSLELLIIPLLFNAYFTAVMFTFVNIILLAIRIPEEEQALITLTEYEKKFADCNRFLPKIIDKYNN